MGESPADPRNQSDLQRPHPEDFRSRRLRCGVMNTGEDEEESDDEDDNEEEEEEEESDELVELGFSKKLTARTEKYRAQITEKLREVRHLAEEPAYIGPCKQAHHAVAWRKAVIVQTYGMVRSSPCAPADSLRPSTPKACSNLPSNSIVRSYIMPYECHGAAFANTYRLQLGIQTKPTLCATLHAFAHRKRSARQEKRRRAAGIS